MKTPSILDTLRSTIHSALDRLNIDPCCRVVLLDYPLHDNIGDLLIWIAELEFFRQKNISPVQIHCHEAIDQIKERIEPDDILFIHGGGNWGDLWETHENFRNTILRQFHKHRIIVFPQTMYYREKTRLEASKTAVSNCKDITIFMRDKISLDLALKSYPTASVFLCPDLAFLLRLKDLSESKTTKKRLLIKRSDHEVDPLERHAPKHYDDILDWPDMVPGFDRSILKCISLFKKILHITAQVLKKFHIQTEYIRRADTRLHQYASEFQIHNAIRVFQRYEIIESNRLHGHILACLLRKRNVLYPNSYYKNKAVYECWTSSDPVSSFKDSLE
jgi:pyruvyl transferase EpsO